MTPFDVFEKDIDEFIILANYLMNFQGEQEPEKRIVNNKKETRIRVNDKTATGGWF